jgi:hypothetical protein
MSNIQKMKVIYEVFSKLFLNDEEMLTDYFKKFAYRINNSDEKMQKNHLTIMIEITKLTIDEYPEQKLKIYTHIKNVKHMIEKYEILDSDIKLFIENPEYVHSNLNGEVKVE